MKEINQQSAISNRDSPITIHGWQSERPRHILAATNFGEVAEWSKAALC
ncbi:MAG: hypothetical protein ACR2FX_03920 [Chthoniobacterales bacterium]